MKKKAQKAIKFLVFFAIGLSIFWWLYKDQDINRIKSVLQNNVNYFWVWVSVFIGILSHISRAIRWNYLIEPMGAKPRRLNTFLAVMVGYLMNMVLPRMGEISRCGVLAKYEKISFARLVGTVVTERIVDVIMLLLMAFLTLVLQFGQVLRFLNNNPEIALKIKSMIVSPWLIIGFIIVVAAIFFARNRIKRTGFFRKIQSTLSHFKEGLLSIRNMKNKGAFIFHSFFIWTMYYLMLYVSFFAFDFTAELSPVAGLTTFVMASFGMLAPVQGGIGPWHFMVIETLSLYGIAREDGIIFAFLAHSAMTLMLIVIGIMSVLVLPFVNPVQKEETAG